MTSPERAASTVSAAYRNAIITAEHELQSRFTDPTTINLSFDLTA